MRLMLIQIEPPKYGEDGWLPFLFITQASNECVQTRFPTHHFQKHWEGYLKWSQLFKFLVLPFLKLTFRPPKIGHPKRKGSSSIHFQVAFAVSFREGNPPFVDGSAPVLVPWQALWRPTSGAPSVWRGNGCA